MRNPSSFFSRHIRATVATGVAAVAVVGGGIAYAATNDGSTNTPVATALPAAAAPTSAPASTPTGHKATHHTHHAVHGTVVAISGNTWTIKTHKATVTVSITSSTVFGTKTAPSSAAAFTVGSRVAVIGKPSGTTIEAKRVFAPKVKVKSPAGSTPSTGAPSTGAPSTGAASTPAASAAA